MCIDAEEAMDEEGRGGQSVDRGELVQKEEEDVTTVDNAEERLRRREGGSLRRGDGGIATLLPIRLERRRPRPPCEWEEEAHKEEREYESEE